MSLEILKQHQRAYENKMQIIDRKGGPNKLQMQVDTLRSWVSDLLAQNALLVHVVEDLEQEAINLVKNRRRFSENNNDLKALHDRMQEKNLSKDREIRRLNQNIHEYKQTIQSLENELSAMKHRHSEVSSEDIDQVQVANDTNNECFDLELLKDYNALIVQENVKCEERLKTIEVKLKVSCDNVRILRKKNVSLTVEIHALHYAYATLKEKFKQVTAQSHFKDDLILELRRQLKRNKEQLQWQFDKAHPKDYVSGDHEGALNTQVSYDSVTIACVRQPRNRKRDMQAAMDDACNTQLDMDTEFDYYQAPQEPCSAHELTQKSI